MKKLKELRQSIGITQAKLAEKIGVTRSTIAMYETGASEPDFETLCSIARFFNVSTDELLGLKIDKNLQPYSINRSSIRIPVYGTIPAGIPIEMIEESYIEDYEDIDADLIRGGNTYFALKVKGESMMPKFENGDVLILKQQDDCENGEFCAVSINHTECTFKKVLKKNNGITLMPLNPEFEPLFFTNEEVRNLPVTILGVVKEVRRSY